MRVRQLLIGVLSGICVGVPGQAHADDSQSAAAAQALSERLQSRQMQAVGMQHPEQPGRFVAALHMPGQLLVVSATHPSTQLLEQRVERREYRDLYVDLQATPAHDSKFFVHDLEADGLVVDQQSHDVVYAGGDALPCDGDWKAAKLTKDEYRQRLSQADARYARILALLSTQVATQGLPQ